MKKFFRRFTRFLIVSVLLLGILYLARIPILRGIGNFLIREDTSQKVEATFVLSGSVIERSQEALKVYPIDSPLLVCMGESISPDLEAFGYIRSDAELMRDALLRQGVDSTGVKILKQGTSTWEESEEILGYAFAQGYKRIMVISSKFHTRRIASVFKKKFREKEIEVIVRGADPIKYEVNSWWQEEEGMIFVTNEYLKLLYYAWKY